MINQQHITISAREWSLYRIKSRCKIVKQAFSMLWMDFLKYPKGIFKYSGKNIRKIMTCQCCKLQRQLSAEVSSSVYPKAFSCSQIGLKGENCKWKGRTRKIRTMQALVMIIMSIPCSGNLEMWNNHWHLRVCTGFSLESLKVKITDARLHTSSNLTGEILTTCFQFCW